VHNDDDDEELNIKDAFTKSVSILKPKPFWTIIPCLYRTT